MEYRIDSSIFWNKLYSIYNKGHDWHLKDEDIQYITKEKLGLIFIVTCFNEEIDRPYDSVFVFEIVDKEKLLWAKIKYGI
jgi:hypothetical protein